MQYDKTSTNNFRKDVKITEVSELLTYSTVMIKTWKNGVQIGSGTGFIINLCADVNSGGIPTIITNDHVIKENDPDKISFELCLSDKENNPIDKETMIIEVKSEDWIHHPRQDIDLCCLPCKNIKNLVKSGCHPFLRHLVSDHIPDECQLKNFVAFEEIYMVGYPDALYDPENNKPITRKGITATHIKKDYDGEPEFVVDCPSQKGSSGSPIYILEKSIYYDKKDECYKLYNRRVYLAGILHAGKYIYPENADGVDSHKYFKVDSGIGFAYRSNLALDFELIIRDKWRAGEIKELKVDESS